MFERLLYQSDDSDENDDIDDDEDSNVHKYRLSVCEHWTIVFIDNIVFECDGDDNKSIVITIIIIIIKMVTTIMMMMMLSEMIKVISFIDSPL